MKIFYLDPNPLGIWDDRIRVVLEQHKDPQTKLTVRHLDNLPVDVRSILLPYPPFFYSEMFRAIYAAQKEGYDAAIIGCAADPGVRDADCFADIPVIGPLKAALHLASFLGSRMAVIYPGNRYGKEKRPGYWHHDNATVYGLRHNVACFRVAAVNQPDHAHLLKVVERDVAEAATMLIRPFEEAITTTVLNQAEQAIEVDGANSVFLACTIWGGCAGMLQERLAVPVIDPLVSSLKLAELLATMPKKARRVM